MSDRPGAPVVSVIMAAYNGAALLSETLASLAAQTMPDFEVIVVDDRSTDATRDLVATWPDPRVRLIALDANVGPVRARNRAVAEARGRYLAALDQDDLCRPERFARQVAYLDAHPRTALLGTGTHCLSDGRIAPSRHASVTTPWLVRWLAQIENPLVWSSVMIRADAARTLDPFTRPELLYAEDFDLYHRIGAIGDIARIDEPLLIYRQHAGGASQKFVETMQASATRVLAVRHAALLGDRAAIVADLLVRHNMGGVPVPDRHTLLMLGQGLSALQSAYLTDHPCDAASVSLIRWETARRWARIGRAGLRAGTIRMADVMAVRPEHLGLGYAGVETLMWSGLVGGTRRARRLVARQALAAKTIRPGPNSANT